MCLRTARERLSYLWFRLFCHGGATACVGPVHFFVFLCLWQPCLFHFLINMTTENWTFYWILEPFHFVLLFQWHDMKNLQDLNTRNISENCFQFLSKIANCLSINCWLNSVEPNYTILNIPQFVIPQSPALPGAVQKTRDGPSSMEVGLTKSQHLNHPGSAMQKFSMESWCPPDLWSISHFWLQTGFSRFMA